MAEDGQQQPPDGDPGTRRGPASQQDMRRQNLALVMRTVAAAHPLSRADVAGRTGLTRTAVSSLVDELIGGGLLLEGELERSGRVGRPGRALVLNGDGPAGLGLEIGVEHLSACVLDLRGEVRVELHRPAANAARSAGQTLAELAELADRAEREAVALGLRVVGRVLAVPGSVPLGSPANQVEHAPNLGWHQVDVTELWPGPGTAPAVENEANLGALAELWQGTGSGTFVHISAGEGIGGALVLDGRLFRGVQGFAGELGHLTVRPDGRPCSCGARGCLEPYAGLAAVLRSAGFTDELDELDGLDGPDRFDGLDESDRLDRSERSDGSSGAPGATSLTGRQNGDPIAELVRRAEQGDPATRRALRHAGTALGTALAAAVNLVDPDSLVLGGGYADLAQWLLPAMRTELAALIRVRPWPEEALRASPLGRRGPVLGAALVTVRSLHSDPAGLWLAETA
ncbi:putative NBD/HSP70 family sugar kinase [Kitasatospora sp. SolWspMP-SS2h]|uniref:ROK family protein n=1 Tax=Kitasatospora sp. SolWspMP-SS2h TaxID=1305729 RepID=UPI000DBAD181|nr:ROK family protein [Kitasatospora sp. SolWspMP-SS2h]RAJ44793.1 putative NBD/HSP70 family sugar kinase [Kitasatospora sp. SolWspMP-SS2h]